MQGYPTPHRLSIPGFQNALRFRVVTIASQSHTPTRTLKLAVLVQYSITVLQHLEYPKIDKRDKCGHVRSCLVLLQRQRH